MHAETHDQKSDLSQPLPAPLATAAISRGLHDMAQPLTMLTGMLELTLIRPQTESEWRMSVEGAIEQAARAVALLNQVRELVNLQRPGASTEVLPSQAAANSSGGKATACPAR
ncbi:MAG TPA: hypothetical protein VMH85_19635 [Terriglobales bacterium]|nr:hypothetical protein [Terriglobales bacterium]